MQEYMMEVMEVQEGYAKCGRKKVCSSSPEMRPLTKFEQRGERLGHGVWDLIYTS